MFEKCSDVRMATPEDCDEIFRLMVLAWEEAGEHEMDDMKVSQSIWAAVHRQASMIGVIGSRGEKLKGYVYLRLDEVWYSRDTQLLELSNFVDPEFRKSDFAKQLICFAKHCSDGLGIDLMMGVVSNERTEAKVRLYRRQIPPVGAFFMYKPSNVDGVA
jgi:GNAT superfamily N-acetyltransferase